MVILDMRLSRGQYRFALQALAAAWGYDDHWIYNRVVRSMYHMCLASRSWVPVAGFGQPQVHRYP